MHLRRQSQRQPQVVPNMLEAKSHVREATAASEQRQQGREETLEERQGKKQVPREEIRGGGQKRTNCSSVGGATAKPKAESKRALQRNQENAARVPTFCRKDSGIAVQLVEHEERRNKPMAVSRDSEVQSPGEVGESNLEGKGARRGAGGTSVVECQACPSTRGRYTALCIVVVILCSTFIDFAPSQLHARAVPERVPASAV